MQAYIRFADDLSAWFGKVFAWCIMVMTFGIGYEVVVRYAFRAPTPWAFDLSYMLYGTLFMMAGAYTLSRDAHVRGDFIYRLWKPRTQAAVELVLYFIFFFPGVTALIFAGWKYAARSWGYLEVSSNSPAGIPIFQFKSVIVAATHGVLSDPAAQRLSECGASEVVVTDTLPIAADKHFPQLTVLSIAPLLARAIREVFDDGSVTSLFDGNS